MALVDLGWMLPPLVMCLVLGGIHGYLGIHVLSRKVIFVDLALAQIAALGAVCANLLGYDSGEQPGVVYLVSLGFTFVGAGVFAWTRSRKEIVPQEALIGVSYATASAIALMLLSKASGEAEHIKTMLAGNVLLVTWPKVLETAALYVGVGALHFVFRKPFREISEDPEAAALAGRRVRLWDFFFYATFGVVITSSVAVAGVLLVFSFLVVPAAIGFFLNDQLRGRLLIAWIAATLGSLGGILLSYGADMPTAPSVVVCLAVLLVVAAAVRVAATSKRPVRALGFPVAAGVGILALAWLGTHAGEHGDGMPLPATAPTSVEDATQLGHALLRAEVDDNVAVILAQIIALGPDAGQAAPFMVEAAHHSADPFLQLDIIRALMVVQPQAGLVLALELVDSEPPALVEMDLDAVLLQHLGRGFGLGEGETETARKASRDAFRQHLRSLSP